jgi:hypothetical protein
VWHTASEEIYKAQQAAQPGAGGTEQPHANGNGHANGDAKKDEAVTDVDFEEVKDDKKK